MHVLGRIHEPRTLCGVRRGTGDHELMCLAEPGLREVQVHKDELAAGSSLLHNELKIALHRLAVFRQVFDELALAVHMDVNWVCLRVEPKAIVTVLLLNGRSDHPFEVMFPETRKRQGDHNGFLGGTQNREVRGVLLLVHFMDSFQVSPLSSVLSGFNILTLLYSSVNSSIEHSFTHIFGGLPDHTTFKTSSTAKPIGWIQFFGRSDLLVYTVNTCCIPSYGLGVYLYSCH